MNAKTAATLALGAVWLAPLLARAQETTELEALLEQKVVTSASKSAETTDSAPASAVTITADDLRRLGIRRVDEAIRFVASGVNLLELPYAHVNTRGVALAFDYGAHVLVLVDGHAVNSTLNGRADLNHGLFLPIELVDHIEVILGPGSVLYGSNAMQGVVNVVTKRAEDLAHVSVGLDAELGKLYRGAAASGVSFELFHQPSSLVLAVEHIDESQSVTLPENYVGLDPYTGEPVRTRPEGPADGIWGGQWDNYYAQTTSGYARLQVGRFRLGARAGAQRSSDPMILFDFDNPEAGYRRSWVSLDAEYAHPVSQHLDLSVRIYGDSYRDDTLWRSSAAQYCLPGMLGGCELNIVGGAESLGIELQSHVDWLGDARQVTLLGVDARVRNTAVVTDIIDATTGENPGSTAYRSETDAQIGTYAQHVARLGPTVRVNAGARFDAYESFGNALSPRAALVYAPFEQTTFKAIYSSAFRAPPPSILSVALPLLIVQADGLENERVQSVELVAEQRIGTQRLSTSLFAERWEDMIQLVRLSSEELDAAKASGEIVPFAPSAYQYRNAAQVRSVGLTLGYAGSLVGGKLRYGASATEAFARRTIGGDDQVLEGAPSIFGNAHTSYELGGELPTLGLAAYATGSMLVFNTSGEGSAAPPTVDPSIAALASVSGPVPSLAALRYRVGVRVASSDTVPVALSSANGAQQGSEPVLLPADPLRVLIGLEYAHDF